ncbi:hypothetical protein [Thermomonas paludicola]|uniref:hypothetical protein n=1 Tax=Thermomonas paludicola TaxID=2884874 RepID=UPI00211508BF|nr:hypothetical protein [Thermomonas paludicola]
MRIPTMHQLLACFVLTGAFGHAGAYELRHPATESAAGSDVVSVPAERPDDIDIDAAVTASRAQHPSKPKAQAPALPTRTAGDTRTMPSRFHSFLPGMFR